MSIQPDCSLVQFWQDVILKDINLQYKVLQYTLYGRKKQNAKQNTLQHK